MKLLLLFFGWYVAKVSSFVDCSGDAETQPGPFGPTVILDSVDDGNHTLSAVLPTKSAAGGPWPVLIYFHCLSGFFTLYKSLMEFHASHGFVVLFPYIVSPGKDKFPTTTDTNGWSLDRTIAFAHAANNDSLSPLYQKLDTANIVLAGHSMGATGVIMAAQRLGPGTVKAVVAQHPGLCGPIGPPPRFGNATWMKFDMAHAMEKFPILHTTSENDGAFLPAPLTWEHEHGCFAGGWAQKAHGSFPSAFVSFNKTACKSPLPIPVPGIGGLIGHCCPVIKHSPETQWVLRHLKLYAQLQGSKTSKCFQMLWGDGADSLRKAASANLADVHSEDESKQVVI